MGKRGKHRKLNKKLWHERRSKKILAKLSNKDSTKQGRKSQIGNTKQVSRRHTPLYNTVVMPKHFSITENAHETIKCFETISNKLKLKIGDTVMLDFSKVEVLGIDAIMYLIAFMQNHAKQGNRMNISGNYPICEQARKDMINSGFLDFVTIPNVIDKEQLKKEDTFMITVGEESKPEVMRDVKEFAVKTLGGESNDLRFIYTIVGELITNTNDHAYTDYKKPVNRWYLYSKLEDGVLKFTILDTGLGIPETINKKLTEKLGDFIRLTTDSQYIYEALQGKHKSFARSRTKDENRNKGLPRIYDFYKQGKIKNLKIVSNNGTFFCTCESEEKKDIDLTLKGTLIYWEVNYLEEGDMNG